MVPEPEIRAIAEPHPEPTTTAPPEVRPVAEVVPAQRDWTPPAYLETPVPDYPPLARRHGWQGEVLLRVHTSAEGKVSKAMLEKSSGYALLDREALRQVRRWKFKPAMRGGVPVAGEVTVPVLFTLE